MCTCKSSSWLKLFTYSPTFACVCGSDKITLRQRFLWSNALPDAIPHLFLCKCVYLCVHAWMKLSIWWILFCIYHDVHQPWVNDCMRHHLQVDVSAFKHAVYMQAHQKNDFHWHYNCFFFLFFPLSIKFLSQHDSVYSLMTNVIYYCTSILNMHHSFLKMTAEHGAQCWMFNKFEYERSICGVKYHMI